MRIMGNGIIRRENLVGVAGKYEKKKRELWERTQNCGREKELRERQIIVGKPGDCGRQSI